MLLDFNYIQGFSVIKSGVPLSYPLNSVASPGLGLGPDQASHFYLHSCLSWYFPRCCVIVSAIISSPFDCHLHQVRGQTFHAPVPNLYIRVKTQSRTQHDCSVNEKNEVQRNEVTFPSSYIDRTRG